MVCSSQNFFFPTSILPKIRGWGERSPAYPSLVGALRIIPRGELLPLALFRTLPSSTAYFSYCFAILPDLGRDRVPTFLLRGAVGLYAIQKHPKASSIKVQHTLTVEANIGAPSWIATKNHSDLRDLNSNGVHNS
jgi:hypothetical protein